MVPGSFQRKALLVERLENRELMAGDVTAYVEGQMLVISGDAADNGVTLTYNSGSQTYRVTGRDAGGSPTTINGLDTSQPGNVVEFSGVQQVYVGLKGGNDNLEVGSPEAVDTVIRKWFSIEMGDGDDDVTLGASGNAPSGSAPIARSLDVGTSLNVDLGAGNDDLTIGNAEIGLNMALITGDGNDRVIFDTSFTPSGTTTATLFPVMVSNHALISLGGGTDELTMSNASIRGGLTILDGAGAADILLYNVAASESIAINTAGDVDQIDLELITAKRLSMNTNNGADQVRLFKGNFKTLNIKLGGGRDRLRLNRTRVSMATHLNGEAQSATLLGANNVLRGVWRRSFG